MAQLSTPEIRRFTRHIRLSNIGLKGQEKLKQARILVAGIGSLGTPVLQYLTTAGVGTIGIIDYAVVNEEHLPGQTLFLQYDIGKHKSIVAKKRLEAQNPYLTCEIYNLRLKDHNLTRILQQYHLVMDCANNSTVSSLINDTCIQQDIPHVYAAVSEFTGELSVFNYRNGPSYRCMYPQAPEQEANDKNKGLFTPVAGILGTMQASEALKIITRAGEALSGNLLTFNSYDFTWNLTPIERNPHNFEGL